MDSARRPRRVAVIGVGNDLRGDDGVGFAVVARLRQEARRTPLPAGTVLHTGDGDAARLMTTWENTSATIVIDAARTGSSSRPGSVRRFELGGEPQWPAEDRTSSHGLGLAAAVELAHALDRLPRTVILYTIESADFDLGIGMSRRVGAAVVPAARRIAREIRRLTD
jgi:hydrogenase maturation protease